MEGRGGATVSARRRPAQPGHATPSAAVDRGTGPPIMPPDPHPARTEDRPPMFTHLPATLAHAGHGRPESADSVLHYVTEPVHLAAVLAAVALGAAVGWWAARRSAAGAAERRG